MKKEYDRKIKHLIVDVVMFCFMTAFTLLIFVSSQAMVVFLFCLLGFLCFKMLFNMFFMEVPEKVKIIKVPTEHRFKCNIRFDNSPNFNSELFVNPKTLSYVDRYDKTVNMKYQFLDIINYNSVTNCLVLGFMGVNNHYVNFNIVFTSQRDGRFLYNYLRKNCIDYSSKHLH